MLPTVRFNQLAWQKAHYWTQNARSKWSDKNLIEIGWVGEVELDSTLGQLTVTAVHLVPFRGTAATVETVGILEVRQALDEAGVNLNSLRCWGHSHPGMKAFQSSGDQANLLERFKDWADYAIGVTLNDKGESYADVVMWKPFFHRFENCPVTVNQPWLIDTAAEDARIVWANRQAELPAIGNAWQGEDWKTYYDKHYGDRCRCVGQHHLDTRDCEEEVAPVTSELGGSEDYLSHITDPDTILYRKNFFCIIGDEVYIILRQDADKAKVKFSRIVGKFARKVKRFAAQEATRGVDTPPAEDEVHATELGTSG